jgi:LPS export ABC transporter protein LptC
MALLLKLDFSKSILLILFSGMLFSCQNDIEQIEALTEDQNFPVQIVRDGTFHYTQQGKLRNTLKATFLEQYEGENPHLKVSEGFTLFMYDSLENIEATLQANEGIFIEQEQRMEARDDVMLWNLEGEILRTEELIWQQDSDKVYTDKFVSISTKDGIIYGKGLVSDSRFKSYSMKNLSGDLYVDDPAKKDSLNGSEEKP